MNYPVKQLEKSTSSLRELALCACLLGFGASTVSSGLFEICYPMGWLKTFIGLISCLGVLLYMALSYLSSVNKTITVEGFIVYNENTKEIKMVSDYLGSTVISFGIRNGCACEESIKRDWNSGPLVEYNEDFLHKLAESEGLYKRMPFWMVNDSTKSAKVLEEFLQYDMIQTLVDSIEYDETSRKIRTRKINRDNAPETIKRNRFFAIFTNEEAYEKSVHLHKSASYSRFQAKLPEKCSISVDEHGGIFVEDKYYELRIKSEFSSASSLPSDFFQYYMGIDRDSEWREYSISISVDVKIKLAMLFSRKRRAYITWIDSFLNRINENYSKDAFLERINWSTFRTIASYIDRIS